MSRAHLSLGFIAAALLLAPCRQSLSQPASPPAAPQPEADPAKPRRAWRLAVAGDLVCSSLAPRLLEEFKRIKAARAEVIIIQISAARWRGDIVTDVCTAIRDSDLPVHVILKHTQGDRVGLGSLMVGLSAASLWVAPQTTIANAAGDRVPSTVTAVKELKAENEALTEIIDAALARRAAPVELGPLLVSPTGPRWLAVSNGNPHIVDTDPPDQSGVPVITNEVDGVRVSFTSGAAITARLIDGVRGGDSVFKHMGFLPARPKAEPALRDELAFTADSTLACDTDGEYRQLCESLASLDDAMDRVQRLLDPPGSTKPTAAAKSQAERDLVGLRRSVDELERQLKTAPELAQRPVPGQTEVAVKSTGWPAKWRSAVQKRRDQITRLAARAK